MKGLALALLAGVLAAAPPAASPASPAPMTNEDVVRLVAGGVPETQILEAIRTRPAAFDLSDEMVEELKLAGVSGTILAAMAARAPKPAPIPPPEERAHAGLVPLRVELAPRTLKVPGRADEELKHRLQLPKELEDLEVHDLAVFLACEAATHVPDQWRSRSPLGRDMTGTKRHEMLAFVPGETPDGRTPQLKLPSLIEGQVDPDEPHDLALGIAARIGDRWLVLATGRLSGVKAPPEGTPLSGTIRSRGAGFDFEVKLERPR